MEEQEKKSKNFFKGTTFIVSIFLIVIIVSIYFYSSYFSHTIYPGVYMNKKSFTNMSYSDVYNFLESQEKIFQENGITYKYENKETIIQPIITTIGDDIINEILINFDNKKTAKHVFAVGRSGNFINRIFEQLRILIVPKHIDWQYEFDEEAWKNILKENFREFEKPYKDPSVSYDGDNIVINDSITGREFDYDDILKQTKKKIYNFDFSKINLFLKETKSSINKEDAMEKIEDIEKIINAKELKFKYEDKSWKITNANYKKWLIFQKDENSNIYVTLDYEKFKEYFDKYIAIDINQEAQDAKFKITNGRVSEFQSSQDGIIVNIDKVFENIEKNLENIINGKENEEISLVVDITKSEVNTSNINDFGIKELIGTGVSDFKGSPPNRIHNIKTGARILNGILIPPGEEFTTIKNLLPIDAANGYLQELVIKGNRTIPEYGGGLCQIGTTMFRAAIQSGLDITERREHSYRVVYYEPAGTDATIYDPRPDLRFINDTGHYILIQSRIVGTKLYFDFWGTKDGRKITVSDPVIYNIKSPGPTRIIESSDLKPGEKRCTESAHNGADAYFDYRVEYFDERETKEQRFSSHYVPWQAVCLVGASASSTGNIDTGSTGSSTTSTSQ